MSNSEKLARENEILKVIEACLSGIRCVVPTAGVVYASSPLTTGLRLYSVFDTYGVKSAESLKAKDPAIFRREVMEPNITEGSRFAKTLEGKRFAMSIAPGKFFADGWLQEHYMSFWEQVIVRSASAVALNINWEFSSGCAEEFLIGLIAKKKLFDHNQKRLDPKDALSKLRAAIDAIDQRGFDTTRLFGAYRRAELFVSGRKIDLIDQWVAAAAAGISR